MFLVSLLLYRNIALKEIELNLSGSFLRVHRSTILNIAAVSETRKAFKGRFNFFFNSDKVGTVRSGASYKDEIVEMLKL